VSRSDREDGVKFIALVVNRADQARIREALPRSAEIVFCQYASDLVAAVRAGEPRVVLVEPVDARGAPVAAAVERIRAAFPGLPVLAYGELRRETTSQLLALARAGVSDVVVRGQDDLRSRLTAAVNRAERRTVADLVLARIGPDVPPVIDEVVRCFLNRADDGMTVERVARKLGLHRRTLTYRMKQAGFPAPRAVAGWCRLLLAARELDDPRRSVERVAMESAFTSAAALRNMLKRHTGLSPAQLRRLGGFAYLCGMFAAFLEESRRPSPMARMGGAVLPAPLAETIRRRRRWLSAGDQRGVYHAPRVETIALVAMILPIPRAIGAAATTVSAGRPSR
jgi:AraC-like DNA-binding protein